MTTAQLGVIVAACVAMAAFAAAVVQAQEPTMSLPNATITADFGPSFQPAEVVIPAGGAVEWKNATFFARAVTDDPAFARGLVKARLPTGAQPFDSGAIAPGGAWRRSFTVPGRYVYFYRPSGRHQSGVVIVR